MMSSTWPHSLACQSRTQRYAQPGSSFNGSFTVVKANMIPFCHESDLMDVAALLGLSRQDVGGVHHVHICCMLSSFAYHSKL